MLLKIISVLLIAITVYLNIKHGWSGLSGKMSPEETKMMTDLGIGKTMVLIIGIASLAVAGLTLFPQTFLIGNLLNATLIAVIMGMALNTQNLKMVLIEIPFFVGKNSFSSEEDLKNFRMSTIFLPSYVFK